MIGASVGEVVEIVRYPVKSLAGEQLAVASVSGHGIVGDRGWAVYTADGGIGSGKNTRRFRRIPGLLDLRAWGDPVPMVAFPDGRVHRADDDAAADLLSALLGRPLSLRPQTSIRHHDESPVHVVTAAAIRRLEEVVGAPVDTARFRPNLVLDVDNGFVEGADLAIGDEVVLRLGAPMPRCVMVGLAQPHCGLGPDSRLLKALGRDVEFGLQATVVRGGTVRVGDPVDRRPPTAG